VPRLQIFRQSLAARANFTEILVAHPKLVQFNEKPAEAPLRGATAVFVRFSRVHFRVNSVNFN
jgi:hypothetical protein